MASKRIVIVKFGNGSQETLYEGRSQQLEAAAYNRAWTMHDVAECFTLENGVKTFSVTRAQHEERQAFSIRHEELRASRTRKYEQGRSSIFLLKEAAETLRGMAAHFGFYVPTGTGAHTIGNNAAFLEAVTTAYARSSEEERNEFLAEMRNLLKLG